MKLNKANESWNADRFIFVLYVMNLKHICSNIHHIWDQVHLCELIYWELKIRDTPYVHKPKLSCEISWRNCTVKPLTKGYLGSINRMKSWRHQLREMAITMTESQDLVWVTKKWTKLRKWQSIQQASTWGGWYRVRWSYIQDNKVQNSQIVRLNWRKCKWNILKQMEISTIRI